ncbi:MAG: dihydrolipoyl dehydrogenase [Candidatus Bipolaricaulia bacterium]
MVVGDIAMGTELLIVGGGPGGYVAAIRAAQLGIETTLVEAEDLGGICLNHGCIPSKALIQAAHRYGELDDLAEMGIEVGERAIHPEKLQEWKSGVVTKLTGGVGHLLEHHSVQVVPGKAVFTGPKSVHVESEDGSQSIDFKHAIVSTGSTQMDLPGFEMDGEVVIGSRQALQLTEVPDKMVVIGGGYIGLELGSVYAQLGSEVTVVEMLDQLLPGTDPDLVKVVEKQIKALGITVHTESKAQSLEKTDDGAKVTVETPDGETSLEADKVLVSIGRQPNSADMGLEQAKVETTEQGFIAVDHAQRTSNDKIYAIGDITGQPMLAHKASHEGLVAAAQIAGEPAASDWLTVPAVIFTDPEIAYAGLTEADAKEQGFDPVVGKFPFQASGRALTMNVSDGFAKVVADRESEVVLGVQIVGPEASTLISEGALAIEMGARLEDLALTVHPHPTLSESLMEAAELALGQPIHTTAPRKQK